MWLPDALGNEIQLGFQSTKIKEFSNNRKRIFLSEINFNDTISLMDEWGLLIVFAGVGFVAQMIDGGLGMGFGITANAVLLCFGVTPAAASASVHVSKIFTSGISGVRHWKTENISKKLFWNLMIPGVVGGVAGAYFLSNIDGDKIKPFIAAYLFFLGIMVTQKAFRKLEEEETNNHFYPIHFIGRNLESLLSCSRDKKVREHPCFARVLGGIGGLIDSVGGGGWGPIVTSTLISKDHNKKHSIGSAISADFFITLATSITFLITLGFLSSWYAVFGLLIGGAVASPMSSVMCHRIAPRSLMLITGLSIVGMSFFVFVRSVFF